MISILIPTYHFDPSQTVRELHAQADELKISFEILIADDDPNSGMAATYQKLNELTNVHAFINPKNLGRRGNRDYLASKARFDFLLFLDEDALICNRNFLKTYLEYAKPNLVVCGGVEYCLNLPDAQKRKLRYRYGIFREVKSASDRNARPYASFITFNFLIPKDIYLQLPIHTEILGYGYEDTMMGYDLKYRFVPVLHIDNAACHSQVDDSVVFLQKTNQALENLSRMIASGKVDDDIKLYKTYSRMQSFGLTLLLRILYSLTGNFVADFLVRNNGPLWLYDVYRLMYLSTIKPEITGPGAWR